MHGASRHAGPWASLLDIRCPGVLTYARDPGVRTFAIVLALLVYGAELTSFTLSIDEELHAYAGRPWRAWTAQGRWAMGLLTYLLPPLATTPLLPTALFAGGLVLAAVLLAGCFARSRSEAVAFVGLFVSCPIWLHIGEFNTLSWGYAIGLALAAIAVVLLHAGGYPAAIVAGLSAAVACGIYQGLVLIVVCGSLLGVAVRLAPTPDTPSVSIRRLAEILVPVGLSWAIAAAVYYGVSMLVLAAAQLSVTHVDVYVRVYELTSPSTVVPALVRTARRVLGLAVGTDPTFLGWGIASLLLVWMGVLGAIVRALFRSDSASATLVRTLLVAAAIGVALLPVLVSAGIGPLRSLSALPLLYAAAAAAAMRERWLSRVPHWTALALALFVNAWIAATLFNADAIARERDRIVATQLAMRIADLAGYRPDQRYPLVVMGERDHEAAGPARHVEIFGSSFFGHDGGNPFRIAAYLRLLGFENLRAERLREYRDSLAEIERLPAWPAPGSVAMIKDAIVIKLGPMSHAQSRVLAP